MKASLRIFSAVAALSGIQLSAAVYVVDVARIISESGASESFGNQIRTNGVLWQAKMSKVKGEIERLQLEANTADNETKLLEIRKKILAKEAELKTLELEQQTEFRKLNEEFTRKVMELIGDYLRKNATDENFVVFDKRMPGILHVKGDVDMTEKVLEYVKSRWPAEAEKRSILSAALREEEKKKDA